MYCGGTSSTDYMRHIKRVLTNVIPGKVRVLHQEITGREKQNETNNIIKK